MIINLRKFRGMNLAQIKEGIPITVTSDDEPVFMVVQIDNQATTHKQDDNQSITPTVIPLQRTVPYRPGMVLPKGTLVQLPDGRVVPFPELDSERNPIWE